MMTSDDQLLAVLRERAEKIDAFPPLTEAQVRMAEERLGIELPSLLRRIYLEVGNGGFGLHLLPLTLSGESLGRHSTPQSVVAWYRGLLDDAPTEDELREHADQEPMREWPKHLLKISDWGCNIYSCLDLSKPGYPLLRNDYNQSWNTMAVEAPSLHEWLERWLAGEDMFSLDWQSAQKVHFPTVK